MVENRYATSCYPRTAQRASRFVAQFNEVAAHFWPVARDFFCVVMLACISVAHDPADPGRLFKNYEDLINFDTTLKHQTPM